MLLYAEIIEDFCFLAMSNRVLYTTSLVFFQGNLFTRTPTIFDRWYFRVQTLHYVEGRQQELRLTLAGENVYEDVDFLG